jgi:cytochrome c oxidase subunit 4
MSTTDTTEAEPAIEDELDEHPSDMLYVQIAAILAFLTALEVLTYFVDFGAFQTPALLIMMTIKFAMVLMFFMHLRFDNKLFSAVFIAGLVLAGAVYVATLLTFEFF